jgi:succinoglycan biosynthesis transport protein ExoP
MNQFGTEFGLERRGRSSSTSHIADEVGTTHPELRSYGTEAPESNLLVDYYRTLLRHRKLIMCAAAIGLFGTALLHLTTQPVYRTRTALDIQSLNGDFMNEKSVDPTAMATSTETNVQTQIKLLESDTLMERVQDRLTIEPHPAFVERSDLFSRMERALHLGKPGSIPFQALLNETAKGVKVKPLGITELVEVTCDSWDPAFAAKFCNTLTGEFQAQDLESRGSEAKRTSDWLMHQAADVRQKAQDSEQQLFAATGGNGLILSEESNSVGEDRLRQMQAELVKAQADRIEKQAEVTIARSASPDSTPNIVADPAYAAARTKLADLEGQVAALVPPLTEANPKIIHLRAEIKQVQDAMDADRTEGAQRLQNEFEAAQHRENLLKMTYETQEAGVSSDLEKGSKVALLRREVESEQQLYQTLLQRAKEAGFASAMQAATIRVVDVARVPRLAVYPQRITAAAIGLILGSIAGLAIAFFKDRNTAVLRAPGESSRLLQVQEIGVIPSPPRGSGFARLGAMTSGATLGLRLPAPNEHPALQTARWDDRFSLVAEAYRNATMSIMLSREGRESSVYVISSPNAGEGKTTVTSNLGVALSKSKLRVLLIEGDLRKSSLHETMHVANAVGLRDILRGEVDLEGVSPLVYCQPTAFPKLFVVPSGTGSEEAVELLHSSRLHKLVERLKQDFDVILIDTPPMLHMVDARIFAGYSDAVILILRAGVTTREQAMMARDLFDHDRVAILGTVLNDFNPSKEGRFGYYKSYYAYQQPKQSERATAVRS